MHSFFFFFFFRRETIACNIAQQPDPRRLNQTNIIRIPTVFPPTGKILDRVEIHQLYAVTTVSAGILWLKIKTDRRETAVLYVQRGHGGGGIAVTSRN